MLDKSQLSLVKLTLYSRNYCHLCEDMLEQLKSYLNNSSIRIDDIEVIDVDADEDLVAQFDELVPVLFGKKEGMPAQQICHYFLNVEQLKAFLHE